MGNSHVRLFDKLFDDSVYRNGYLIGFLGEFFLL